MNSDSALPVNSDSALPALVSDDLPESNDTDIDLLEMLVKLKGLIEPSVRDRPRQTWEKLRADRRRWLESPDNPDPDKGGGGYGGIWG